MLDPTLQALQLHSQQNESERGGYSEKKRERERENSTPHTETCLVHEGQGVQQLGVVGEVALFQQVSDCGHNARVVPLALPVHRVPLHVHEITCTCWRVDTVISVNKLCCVYICTSSHMSYTYI